MNIITMIHKHTHTHAHTHTHMHAHTHTHKHSNKRNKTQNIENKEPVQNQSKETGNSCPVF